MQSPLPALFISADVRAFDGRLVQHFSGPAHSFVRNAYNLFFAALSGCGGDASADFGAGFMSARDMAGVIYDSPNVNLGRGTGAVPGPAGCVPQIASPSFGLIVGNGAGTWHQNSYDIDAQLPHGISLDEISYGVGAVPVLAYDQLIWTAEHVRNFSNLGSENVAVTEVGLVWLGSLFGASASFLIAWDILSETLIIPPLSILQIKYIMSYDFTVIDGS